MAEHMVASALAKVAGLLGSVLMQEATFLSGVRDDFEWLQSELRWMASFVKDADAKRKRGDAETRIWLREVREFCNQADDIIDNFLLQIETRAKGMKQFFRKYSCIPSELWHLHFLGGEIQRIRNKAQRVRARRDRYGIIDLGTSSEPESLPHRQRANLFDDDTVVVGFKVNVMFIRDLLLDPAVKRRSVVSIVGMGGVGKTTLAAKVFNSRKVRPKFQACAWISVSQDYKVKELLGEIAEKVNCRITDAELEHLEQIAKQQEEQLKWRQQQPPPPPPQQHEKQQEQHEGSHHPESSRSLRMEEDKLRSKLYFFLKQIKYLIVLDDVWEEVLWEEIKAAFPNTKNGSRLLITTRSKRVAVHADSNTPLYELPLLSSGNSLELFLKKAFATDQQGVVPSFPKDLEQVGHEIVKRCSGLPLALVVVGGLLSLTPPTINDWQDVLDSMDWGAIGVEPCLRILALSYHHLPNYFLKACFIYLGCFPEDYIIKASEITRLWIAEGFIPQNQNQTLEETAKSYLDELVQRSMVRVVDRTTTTRRVKSFRIHDLLRDFCIKEAEEDGIFKICSKKRDTPEHEIIASRRLVLYDYSHQMFQCSNYKLRSVLGFNLSSSFLSLLRNITLKFNLLRVIHLSCPEPQFKNHRLSEKFSSLIHLRSITLRCDGLAYIPSSFGKLRYLQTLDVRGTNIHKLPKTLYKIESLRHICTRQVFSVEPSASIGSLRSLQTLKFVKAGSWIQRDLAKLSTLRKLAISHISSATQVSAIVDSLHRLNRLTSLSLHTEQPLSATLPIRDHQYLYKLVLSGPWNHISHLPQKLISLALKECKLDKDATADLEGLASLVNLKLNDCRYAEGAMVFSNEGGFSRLQNLQVMGLTVVKGWKIGVGSMQSLTNLKLGYGKVGSLDQVELNLPDGLEGITSLQKLVIVNNDDENSSRKTCMDEFRKRISANGMDHNKIKHVPFVEIDA